MPSEAQRARAIVERPMILGELPSYRALPDLPTPSEQMKR
jgi:hypothetical protein